MPTTRQEQLLFLERGQRKNRTPALIVIDKISGSRDSGRGMRDTSHLYRTPVTEGGHSQGPFGERISLLDDASAKTGAAPLKLFMPQLNI